MIVGQDSCTPVYVYVRGRITDWPAYLTPTLPMGPDGPMGPDEDMGPKKGHALKILENFQEPGSPVYHRSRFAGDYWSQVIRCPDCQGTFRYEWGAEAGRDVPFYPKTIPCFHCKKRTIVIARPQDEQLYVTHPIFPARCKGKLELHAERLNAIHGGPFGPTGDYGE